MFRGGYYANLCSLRLTPSPSARRKGTTKLRKRLLHNTFVLLLIKQKVSTYRHLLASFKGGRWGSNGEAEARIPLKINIYFILATHNNTPSYKQKQSTEGAFLVEELSAARRRKAHTTKKRKVKPCVCFRGGRWGSNGEAEARIPLKINISFILATHNNTPSYKQKQSAEGAFLVEELSAARRRKAHTTKKTQGKNLASVFGVEDGVRTHDLRNHNPAL